MTTKPRGRALEYLLWALGIVLLLLYCGAVAHGELERKDAISAFAEARADAAILAAAGPDQSSWSEARIQEYEAISGSASSPVALLRIPSVQLEVPVYMDASERNLNRGAGLIEGTALPDGDDNIGIAAHRDGYFRALRDVAMGDILEIESLSGQRAYQVVGLFVVEPTEVWPLYETGAPVVTLVTCYPFYFVGNAPKRYIVRAVLLSETGVVQ